MKVRKLLATILVLAMTLSMLSAGALATENEENGVMPISDTEQTAPVSTLPADAAASWAAGSIERWSDSGIVKGDGNGNFNPDAQLSRAELAQIFVSMFGLTEKAENTFGDLKGDEWYADAILKCVAAGIMKGDGINANAEAKISRQETIVMFGRAVGVTPDAKPDLSEFTDAASVADWAAGYMAPLTKMGILSGSGDGTINAVGQIDRASTMALLDKSISEYVTAPGEYEAKDAKKFVVVNMAAKEGEVVISGTTAGVTVSAGTAEGKIVAKDLKADTIKVDGTAALSVEGKSAVGEVVANATGSVTVAKGVTVDTVTANAAGTITNNGTIKELTANAATKVDNKGTITKADVKADGVVLDGKKPTETVKEDDIKAPTDSTGKEIPTTKPGEEKPKPPSGGGYDPGPTITDVGSLETLKAALTNSAVTNIRLTANITTPETLVITRAVVIDGNGKTITGTGLTGADATRKSTLLVGDGATTLTAAVTIKNLTVVGPNTTSGWDPGEYGIKVYNASNVTLTDVTVSDANIGIQVNSSNVTMTGAIALMGNESGGIEVAQGAAVGEVTMPLPVLTVTNAVITNNAETATTPTIWIDDFKGDDNVDGLEKSVVVHGSKLIEMENPAEGKHQMFFFVGAVNEATLNTALAGTNSTITISDTIGGAENYGVYNVTRPVAIKGGTVYGSFVVQAENVIFDGVAISNKYVNAGSAEKSAINVYADSLTVTNCTFTAAEPTANYEPNGITVFPKTAAGSYTITGNTFKNYNGATVANTYLSAAISIAEDYKMANKTYFTGVENAISATLTTKPDAGIMEGENTFEGCAYGYVRMDCNSAEEVYKQEIEYALVCNTLALEDAIATAKSGATILLNEDLSINASSLNKGWNREEIELTLVIDLNKHKLTVLEDASVLLGYAATSQNTATNQKGLRADITIKNGTIDAQNAEKATANFTVEQGQKLTLEGVVGVTVQASGSGFLVRGKDATLNIKNSDITAKGVYAISTNANDAVNHGVVINITDGSTLKTEAGDSDACPLMINVPGTLTVTDSTIIGQRQAVIVRAGTATFNGATINANPVKLAEGEDKFALSPAAWADGNRVAYGGIVVGGRANSVYQDAAVTLTDCTITLGAVDGLDNANCAAIYVAAPGTVYSSAVTVSGGTISGAVVLYKTEGATATITGVDNVVDLPVIPV